MSDDFHLEHLKTLRLFVTNPEGNIFVLKNLPEVVKGALFSRYSRSSLGVKELLIKEFLPQLSRNLEEDFESESLANEAVAFYDRVLDGYGDDSIAELGGAHLALENISILATKTIQDARIGGSPLEKSTRYVDFTQNIQGRNLFHTPQNIAQSSFNTQYLNACQLLFKTYQELFQQLFQQLFQHESKQKSQKHSIKALERAIKAKTYDLIRGLLPASTLTNMGVFGNGRFFETLLMKMRCSELKEIHDIAKQSFTELNKAIPSFVRRAEPSHRHFIGFQSFLTESQGVLNKFISSHKTTVNSESENHVQLHSYEHDAEEKIIATLLYPNTHSSFQEALSLSQSLTDDERVEIFQSLSHTRENRRHKLPRALEMANYTFEITADYGAYRDLHRHRTLTQERQILSTHHGFEIPQILRDTGFSHQYSDAMEFAGQVSDQISTTFPQESQYVVPLGYRVRWMMQINLRALCWLIELRSQPQGHESYRSIAIQMYEQVIRVHPRLASLIKFVDTNSYDYGRISAESKQTSPTTQTVEQLSFLD